MRSLHKSIRDCHRKALVIIEIYFEAQVTVLFYCGVTCDSKAPIHATNSCHKIYEDRANVADCHLMLESTVTYK